MADTPISRPADPMRARLLEMWSSVAPAWEANAAYIDGRGAHITARMLALTQPRPGDRVLELACGFGGRVRFFASRRAWRSACWQVGGSTRPGVRVFGTAAPSPSAQVSSEPSTCSVGPTITRPRSSSGHPSRSR